MCSRQRKLCRQGGILNILSPDVAKTKRIKKLLKEPPHKDLTRAEPEAVSDVPGFDFYPNPGGGSHGKFKNRKDPSLQMVVPRPHPQPVIGVKTVKDIVQWIKENYIV